MEIEPGSYGPIFKLSPAMSRLAGLDERFATNAIRGLANPQAQKQIAALAPTNPRGYEILMTLSAGLSIDPPRASRSRARRLRDHVMQLSRKLAVHMPLPPARPNCAVRSALGPTYPFVSVEEITVAAREVTVAFGLDPSLTRPLASLPSDTLIGPKTPIATSLIIAGTVLPIADEALTVVADQVGAVIPADTKHVLDLLVGAGGLALSQLGQRARRRREKGLSGFVG